jgi:hypothetical protein
LKRTRIIGRGLCKVNNTVANKAFLFALGNNRVVGDLNLLSTLGG